MIIFFPVTSKPWHFLRRSSCVWHKAWDKTAIKRTLRYQIKTFICYFLNMYYAESSRQLPKICNSNESSESQLVSVAYINPWSNKRNTKIFFLNLVLEFLFEQFYLLRVDEREMIWFLQTNINGIHHLRAHKKMQPHLWPLLKQKIPFNKMNNDLYSIQIWETLFKTPPRQLHS